MTAQVLVSTKNMSHQEWLEWRRRGIGGSDAAKIVGVSPFGTPFTVYLEKIGEAVPEEPGEAAEWGTRLEPVIAEKFEEVTGLKLHRVNKMLFHPEYPFMIANIDRKIAGRNEGVEIKTASEWIKSKWDGDEVPDEYYLQAMHYMAVTGFPRWWIAVLIGGNKFRYKCIERNEDVIAALIEAEKRFWWHVENRVPPEPDGSDIATEYLARQYPTSNGQEISLPPDAARWIELYEQAAEDEKAAKALKDEAANKLKAMLGEYERGRVGDRVVTWKAYTTMRLDTKALQVDMPDVYERYARTTESRRFSIK